jgi:hypothetical protein
MEDFIFFKGKIEGMVIENVDGIIVTRKMTKQELFDFETRQRQYSIENTED